MNAPTRWVAVAINCAALCAGAQENAQRIDADAPAMETRRPLAATADSPRLPDPQLAGQPSRRSLLQRRSDLEATRPNLAGPIVTVAIGGGFALAAAATLFVNLVAAAFAVGRQQEYNACLYFANGPYCGPGPRLQPDNSPLIAAGVLAALGGVGIVTGIPLLIRALIGRRTVNTEIEQIDAALGGDPDQR
jgi:hypothetical protein